MKFVPTQEFERVGSTLPGEEFDFRDPKYHLDNEGMVHVVSTGAIVGQLFLEPADLAKFDAFRSKPSK